MKTGRRKTTRPDHRKQATVRRARRSSAANLKATGTADPELADMSIPFTYTPGIN
jgi:hypothetical protein